jgi:hypothetical protein
MLYGLPTLPIRAQQVHIDKEHTYVTKATSVPAYHHPIGDIVYRILSTPSLKKDLYFGPGLKIDRPSEFWHGSLWRESPLFGADFVLCPGGEFIWNLCDTGDQHIDHDLLGTIYQHGDTVKYVSRASGTIALGRIRSIFARAPDVKATQLELEPLRRFDELPRQLQSVGRKRRSQKYNEHWIDERHIVDIQPADIQGTFTLLLQGSEPTLAETILEDVLVTEILYSLPPSTTPRIRPSKDRHLLPVEMHRLQLAPEPSMETLKIFLDIYIDGFGAFRSAYHSLGGIYLTIGNQPAELRQKLRNIFLVGFVPFGVSLEDYIRPLVDELAKLERGVEWSINGVRCWVVVGKLHFTCMQLFFKSFYRLIVYYSYRCVYHGSSSRQ